MQNQMKISRREMLRRDLAGLRDLHVLSIAAVLSSMSLILGKYLQIANPFAEIIRISFENLPVLLAGMLFGPFVGGLSGAVADLVGCLLYGYAINPLVTLGATLVGAVSGAVSHYLVRRPRALSVACSTLAAHLIGSVLVKTAGLAAWYLGSYGIGFWQLVLWRLLNYTLIGAAEGALIFALLRNRAFVAQIERMRRK